MTRAAAAFTLLNTFLAITEHMEPMFGGWNAVAYNLCAGLGYTAILWLGIMSKRIVHRAVLQNNLRFVELTFFNAFWKPITITFHIS